MRDHLQSNVSSYPRRTHVHCLKILTTFFLFFFFFSFCLEFFYSGTVPEFSRANSAPDLHVLSHGGPEMSVSADVSMGTDWQAIAMNIPPFL